MKARKNSLKKIISVIITLVLLVSVVAPTTVSAAGSNITLNSNGGSVEYSSVPVAVGEEISLPLPHRYGFDFTGWYSDSALKVKFDDVFFKEEHKGITLYAGWTNEVFSFESYTPSDEKVGYIPQFYEQSSERAYSGNSSMEYHYTYEYYSQPRTVLDGGIVTDYWSSRRDVLSGFTVATVNTGYLYKVNFKYFVDERTKTDTLISLRTVGKNIWASTGSVNGGSITVYPSEKGEWKDGEIFINTKDLYGQANNLYVMCVAAENKDSKIFIDDLTITNMGTPSDDKQTYNINLSANGGKFSGGLSEKSVTVNEDANLISSLSRPTLDGNDFAGWYLDEELTSPLTSDIKPVELKDKTLYASWSNEKISFEGYPFSTTTTGIFYRNTMSIATDKTYDGTKSLKFNYKSSTDTSSYYSTLRNVAAVQTVEDDTDYIIAFRYLATTLSVNAKVSFSTVSSNIASASQTTTYGNFAIPSTTEKNVWYTGYLRIHTKFKNSETNKLVMSVTLDKSVNTVLYFDAFDVIKADSTVGYVVAKNTADESCEVLVGTVGEKVELQKAKAEGGIFDAWYSDEELTKKAENITYTVDGTVVYAGFNYGEGFENYPWDISGDNPKQYLYFGPSLSIKKSSLAHTGDKYLAQSYVADTDTRDRYDTEPDACAAITSLKDKTTYAVTFSYYLVSAGGNVNVNFCTGCYDNVWGGTAYYGGHKVFSSEVKTGWHTATYLFTTAFEQDYANYLFVYFNTDTKADYIIYIDDVITTEIGAGVSYVKFDYNNGSGAAAYSVKEVGEEIDFPNTDNITDDEFENWYTDKECTRLFESTVHTSESITVYADFKSRAFTTYGFESYKNYLIQRGVGAASSSSRAYSGSRTVKLTYGGNDKNKAAAILGNESTPFYVKSNTTYFVQFYYAMTSNADVDLYVGASSLTFNQSNVILSSPFDASYISKGHNVAYGFITTGEQSSTDSLFICVGGDESATVYIDEATIVEVKDGINFTYFVDTYNNQTYFDLGKYGSAIKYPELPETPDNTLEGWYSDATFKIPLESKTHKSEKVTLGISKWQTYKVTFDEYNYKYSSSKYSVGDDFFVTDDRASEGRFSLKYTYTPTPAYAQTSNYTAQLARLEKDAVYKVTYSYFYESGNTDLTIGFLSAFKNARWSFYREFHDADYTLKLTYADGQWHTNTVYFKFDCEDRECNSLYISVLPKNEEGEATVYLDNIIIESMPKDKAIAGYKNVLGETCRYEVSTVGETATLPKNLNVGTGKSLDGFCLDKNLTVPFTGEGLTFGVNYIYPKFTDNKEDFENYGKSHSANFQKTVDDTAKLKYTSSLKAEDTSDFAQLFKVEDGVTYKAEITYKANTVNTPVTVNFGTSAEDVSDLTVLYKDKGNSVTISETTASYSTATAYFTVRQAYSLKNAKDDKENAEYGDTLFIYLTKDEGDAEITFDSIKLTALDGLYNKGASVLKEQSAKAAGGQAMRFYFGYSSPDAEKVTLSGKTYTLLARGIVAENVSGVKGENGRTEYYPVSLESGTLVSSKTENFDTLWDYDSVLNTAIYSAYITDYYMLDARTTSAVGYLLLTDGENTFTVYTPSSDESVRTGVMTERKRTTVTKHTVNGKTIDNFTVVIPRLASYAYGMKVEELIEHLNEKGYKVTETNDFSSQTDNEILVGDTNRAQSKIGKFDNENQYMISLIGGKLVVRGGNDLATMQAVEDLLAYIEECEELGCGININESFSIYGTYTEDDNKYFLAFDDEFEGNDLNRTLWGDYRFENSGDGKPADSILGGKITTYGPSDPPARLRNGETKSLIRVENGHLVTTGSRLNDKDFADTRASTYWTANFKYGLTEIKADLAKSPATTGMWMNAGAMGRYGELDYMSIFGREYRNTFTELDILENFGQDNMFRSNVHYWYDNGGHNALDGKSQYNARAFYYDSEKYGDNMSDGYHIYSVLWTPDSYTFAFDGVTYFHFDFDENYKTRCPSYLILEAGLGNTSYGVAYNPNVDDDYYEAWFDYARVYQIKSRGDEVKYSPCVKQ